MSPRSRRNKSRHHRHVSQLRQTPVQTELRSASRTIPTQQQTFANVEQYSYIINDLKLVGIIAGAIIALIVILSFIL